MKKGLIILAILIILGGVCFISYHNIDNVVTKVLSILNDIKNNDTKNDDNKTQITSNNDSQTSSSWYYHHYLNSEEQEAYQIILETYQSFKSKGKLDFQCDEDTLKRIREAIQYDHPELFYIANTFSYTIINDGMIIKPQYLYDQQQVKKLQQQLDKITQPIITKAITLTSNYEKIKYIYDYLIDNIEYQARDNDQNIIGALIEEKCVCSGYSQAMAYLLKQLNITCVSVSGYANDDIEIAKKKNQDDAHALNLVELGNEYYYFDVTWGDSMDEEFSKNVPEFRYKNFAMTSSTLDQYFYNEENIIQESNNMELNYYVVNNCYFTDVDKEKLFHLIDEGNKLDDFRVIIKCENQAIFDEIKNMIINGSNYTNHLPRGSRCYSLEDYFLIAII